MAVFDTDLDYTKLIQFTNGSLQLASFVQIRNALIKRFKDIYGNDIDVSPATADGQYINSIALLINNVFQTIKQGYDSLDPAVATGQYLDTLCSYNNINRIKATASKAQLYIYNSTNSPITVNKLIFIDKNNTQWIWDNGGVDKSFAPGEYELIGDVECQELGAISAPGTDSFYYFDDNGLLVKTNNPSEQAWGDPRLYGNALINGTIYQTVDYSGLWVWQYQDADVGEIDETDEELRSRRYMMLGNASVTVLEGLKGNLLNVTGVKDVVIINNPTGSDITLNTLYEPSGDGSLVNAHSIYVVVRYKEGVKIDPSLIGRIIYNKLTPGIITSRTRNTGGSEDGNYTIMRSSNLSNIIYWKICSSISPAIVLSIYCKKDIYDYPLNNGIINNSTHLPTSEVEKSIVKKLINYINNYKIDDYLAIGDLLTSVQQGDIQKNGMSTFFTQSGNIAGDPKYPANLSYFKYTNDDFVFSYSGTDNETGSISIGGTDAKIIEVTNAPDQMQRSSTYQLNVKIYPSTAEGDPVTYTSGDTSILTVDENGLITAGNRYDVSTTITCSAGDASTTITIEVVD